MALPDTQIDFDVAIAGGGIAGTACAAALAGLGWSVLLIEPGQHAERRLAGELLHPQGIAGLRALGLLPEHLAGAVPIAGFAVRRDARNAIHLPYGPEGGAIACDHGLLRDHLLAALRDRPGITLRLGTRVVALDRTAHGLPVVTLSGGDRIHCRLVVAADGASSALRRFAGIGHRHRRISGMTGYTIADRHLPARDHAHVCLGPAGPVLAYAIGDATARVLLDEPVGRAVPRQAILDSLPPELRAALAAAMRDQRGLRFDTADIRVATVARRRVVLIGDAAGSCHPLTASGMTMCVTDALLLQAALRETAAIDNALVRYRRRRRAPHRARLLLAAALYDACAAPEAGNSAIRAGLFRYLETSAAGRAASMRLIAMTDTHSRAILLQLACVIRVALAGQASGAVAMLRRLGMTARLSLQALRYMSDALRAR